MQWDAPSFTDKHARREEKKKSAKAAPEEWVTDVRQNKSLQRYGEVPRVVLRFVAPLIAAACSRSSD